MTKIEEFALNNWLRANQLNSEASAILEILEATGNISVGIELLLGIYKEPALSPTPIGKIGYSDRVLISFESYNKFKDEVTYNYCLAKEVRAWVKKGVERPHYKDLSSVSKEWEPDNYARSLDLTNEEFKANYERILIQDDPDESKSFKATIPYKTWMNL